MTLRSVLKSYWYYLHIIYVILIELIPCWSIRNGWTGQWWSSEGHQKCFLICGSPGRFEWPQIAISVVANMYFLFSNRQKSLGRLGWRKTVFHRSLDCKSWFSRIWAFLSVYKYFAFLLAGICSCCGFLQSFSWETCGSFCITPSYVGASGYEGPGLRHTNSLFSNETSLVYR